MTIDELVKQIINAQLAEQLGTDYTKFRDYIDKLNKTNQDNYNEISKLKSDIKVYTNIINEKINDLEQKVGKISTLEVLVKRFNENQSSFGQQTNNKIADLENKISIVRHNYEKIEKEYYNNSQRISALESKGRELPLNIYERDTKNDLFPNTAGKPSPNQLFDQTDKIMNSFNKWASNPNSILPPEFAYVTGDFRIRTDKQEFKETREETKWIINRKGTKSYLLPNPNYFDQMTNILELYKMDLNLLKVKGKNKIKIIIPCEMSSFGFIEFPGELQLLI